jgi:uncharacterized membrane protein YdbT with pleckstrin-like domain
MSYIKSNLVAGEQVIYQTRLHWIVMLGNVLVAAVLVLGGTLLLYYAYSHSNIDSRTLTITEGGGAALLVCAVVVFFLGLVRRNATEMAVTNRRVVVKTGLASRKTIEMLLNRVESIEVSETTLGRLLGYGAIVVVGTGGSTEPFDKIARPLVFRNHLQQQIERLHPLPLRDSEPSDPSPTIGNGGAPVHSVVR